MAAPPKNRTKKSKNRDIILNVYGLRFNKSSRYRINISIDIRQVNSLLIKLCKTPKLPQLTENN